MARGKGEIKRSRYEYLKKCLKMMSARAEDKDGGEREKLENKKNENENKEKSKVEEEGGFLSSGKPTKEF